MTYEEAYKYFKRRLLHGFCRCPNGHNIPKIYDHNYLRYCPYCSQALDWSDEEAGEQE